ncbi:glycoside hydrolase family 3 C-terminal domain-containing protein [Solitalea sp. MAHUQ-68]|uniref:Glycoside hydrolase family 3 C-terminal domain-containing protein n=1 Tax=Solitalea agri TaxID=2953739 RepID=A0A9X2JCZ5_9SPHI|nr:glycoside hydrolase family 3 N-terminal domain-containing protein [Solitalea agri]MCO4293992.1 glycoside hydrolase family 3 C-terminal domain-containing protein [Solitalea agri]
MNLKNGLLFLLSICIANSAFSQLQTPLYKNANAPVSSRVNDLLLRMTVEEKVGQLSALLGWDMYLKKGKQVEVSDLFKKSVAEQHIGMLWATLRADPWTKKTLKTGLNPELAANATNELQRYIIKNTRLGIPLLLAEECPHGHMAIGTTVFPTAIGQASTWDPDLIEQMASTIAAEARLQGAHIGYGPVLDLAREPRWSRMEETYGEDPYLNAEIGKAMVKGFQGNNLKSGTNIASTLKHFVAYGNPDGGHNGGSISVGQRELFESYLPPFEEAVKAGAWSVMTAYNSVDGIPCSANPFLLKTVLREDWKFNGFTVSDLGSISGLYNNHNVAASKEDAAALAINSGLDQDLGGYGYGNILLKAIEQGKVSQKTLDSAVARVLRLKFEMGLFEQPYVEPNKAAKLVGSTQNAQLANRVAKESIILLKNENHLLPLQKDLKRIAVIGPNADNSYNQLGDYTAPQQEDRVVTVLDGIRNKVGKNAEVTYVKGCNIRDTTEQSIAEAVELAKKSEVAIVVLGGSSARDFKTEYHSTGAAVVSDKISDMESGEGFDRATLDLMGNQLKLLQEMVKTGIPVILVLIEGRPLNLNWAAANVPAIINAWYPGQEGGNAIAEVLFGDFNPAGRLTVSVPKSVGQLPVYYNHKKPSPHGYVEMDEKPLYCFGYGLSYTSFDYRNLQIKVSEEERDLKISVEFKLVNTGKFDGDEVVQLYIKDNVSSVVAAVKQLKRFKRVNLKAGEERIVKFSLTADDLALYDNRMRKVVEPGQFTLMVGASSDDIRVQGMFNVSKAVVW